jgi:hypothetical protein
MGRTDDERIRDYLDSLRRVVARRAALDREIAVCVSAARAAGVPWSMIGDALGTTRQAAQQRYGD